MSVQEPEGTGRKRLDYRGKMILAPMVKVGTLPTRLLALEYGADIVYTEELIDWKLLNSTRLENPVLGTIDYIDNTDNTLVFRTCEKERGHLVLQVGTCNGDRAAAVGKKIEQDVDGIDVNMGCPKSFSLKGGMGAALLTQPDKIVDILTKLVSAVSIPVTCKIRLLPSIEKTIELVKLIETTGVSAIAVHGRTKDQRPNDPNNTAAIRQVAENTSLPVIANGGSSNNKNSPINTHQGIKDFWRESGASSVMIARAAEWNTSVFRPGDKDDVMVVIARYLKIAIHYDYPFNMVKYCLQQLMGSMQDSELGKEFLDASTMGDICRVFGQGEVYSKRQQEINVENRPDLGFSIKMKKEPEAVKRKRKIGDRDVTEMFCPFVRGHYDVDNSNDLPKTKLLNFTRKSGTNPPKYQVIQEDKRFRAVVEVNGECYSSYSWEKNKRYAEQAAALVAIVCLNLDPRLAAIAAGDINPGGPLQSFTSLDLDTAVNGDAPQTTLNGDETRLSDASSGHCNGSADNNHNSHVGSTDVTSDVTRSPTITAKHFKSDHNHQSENSSASEKLAL